MGHYLSDFETDEEYYHRSVLSPMMERIRVYDKERDRGLVHTQEYAEKMESDRKTLQEYGWQA